MFTKAVSFLSVLFVISWVSHPKAFASLEELGDSPSEASASKQASLLSVGDPDTQPPVTRPTTSFWDTLDAWEKNNPRMSAAAVVGISVPILFGIAELFIVTLRLMFLYALSQNPYSPPMPEGIRQYLLDIQS